MDGSLLGVYIGKNDVVGDLVAVVPGIQHSLFGVVIDLRGVRIVVGERQSGNHLCVGVRVEGVCQVGVALLKAVGGIEHTADDEAVTIVVATQARPPGALAADAQVYRVEAAQEDHLLQEALVIQRRVDHPQATLVHRQLHVRVAAPAPRRRVLVVENGVVQHGPGRHVAQAQVVFDDVA